jgi:hypothetical protein
MVSSEEAVEGNSDEDLRLVRKFVREWFRKRENAGFATVLNDLRQIREAAMETMAECFASRVNLWVRDQRPQSIDGKRSLARYVNHQLRALGLAFVCPKTGRPGFFIVEHGKNAKEGRFRLVVPDAEAVRGRWRTTSSNDVPDLALCCMPCPADGELRWTSRLREGDDANDLHQR